MCPQPFRLEVDSGTQAVRKTQHPTQSEPTPRGRHLVTVQQECSSAFGPWDTPLLLSSPETDPRTQLCKWKLESGLALFTAAGTWEKEAREAPGSGSSWAAGRGGAGAPGTLQGTLVSYNSLLPQQRLPTASLGPQLWPLILAWPTGRADRKPIPRAGQLSLRCCDRCGDQRSCAHHPLTHLSS